MVFAIYGNSLIAEGARGDLVVSKPHGVLFVATGSLDHATLDSAVLTPA
jgi:hypothetical protein